MNFPMRTLHRLTLLTAAVSGLINSGRYVLLLPLAAASLSFNVAQAQTETIIHSFAGGTDGDLPYAGLIADSKGNGYGTTVDGGNGCTQRKGCGTVYKVNASGVTILHAFLGGTTDGSFPYGGLVMEKTTGNLYGTTLNGGAHNCGTVFQVAANGDETILWNFGGNPDGCNPLDTLWIDASGNFYGTTYSGGTDNAGMIFKLTQSGNETRLYNFNGGSTGAFPVGGPIVDKAGNIYGTTSEGGTTGQGTIYEVSASGVETVLYSFNGSDGYLPEPSLIFDPEGNLYGTTINGGMHRGGVVFKINPATRVEQTLYSFGAKTDDGSGPYAGVIFADGNLYGTTSLGGTHGRGTVYELTLTGEETILYNFAGADDGGGPNGGLLRDTKGNLYGTTSLGGSTHDAGTIFKLTP